MKTTWMTDDELVAIASGRAESGHPLILPSLGELTEQSVAAAIGRGVRSLRIRASENEAERWASSVELVQQVAAALPLLTTSWVTGDGKPAESTVVTRCHGLGDALAAIELIYESGLHSFAVTSVTELTATVVDAASSAWAAGPEVPEGWPATAPAPVALFLARGGSSVVVSQGRAERREAADAEAVPCALEEVRTFVLESLTREAAGGGS